MIVGQYLVSSKKLKFFVLRNGVGLIGYFPIAISMLVVFNQYKYNKTNQCIPLYVYEFNQYKYHNTNESILLYTRKVQNSARVDMPRDL